jgi:DNA-binding transcriptional ArsR family regulator
MKSVKIIKRGLNRGVFESKAALFKCIGDVTCLKILHVLSKEKEVCVTDISNAMDVSVSAVSHQLSKLRAMGIVEAKRKGQTICYSIAKAKKAELVQKILLAN